MDPEALKHLMPFLAGMGVPVLMGNIEKMHKLMTGGADKAKKGQMPQGAMPPPAGAAPGGDMQMDPQKMQLILQIMKARGMA